MLELLSVSPGKTPSVEEDGLSLDDITVRETSEYSGYLNKLSHKTLIKIWKRRWFKHSDSTWTIQYFVSHQDDVPIGVIDISSARFMFEPVEDHPYCFKIKTSEREYVLEASSKDACFKWLSRLQNSRRQYSLRRTQNLEKGAVYRDVSLPESGLLCPFDKVRSESDDATQGPCSLNHKDDDIFVSKEETPYAQLKRQLRSALRPKSIHSLSDMKLFSKARPLTFSTSEQYSETTFEKSPIFKVDSETSVNDDSNLQNSSESKFKRLPKMQSFRRKLRLSKDEESYSPTKNSSCSNCVFLEDEINQLKSDKLNVEEELEASQEVIKVFRKHLSTVAIGEDTINQLLTVRCGKDTKELLQTKDENIVDLRYKVRSKESEIQTLNSQKSEDDFKIRNFEEQCDMLKGLLQSKDNDIMVLTNRVFELEILLNLQSNEDEQKSLLDLNHGEQCCPKCQASEDASEAYQLQNQFLNSEIVELNKLIEDANVREEKILAMSSNTEARLCQVQSKYLLLLKELHSPQPDSNESANLVSQLVQDALEQDSKQQKRNTYSTIPRSSRYDEFGFDRTWGIEDGDALVQKVEDLKQRSNAINESLQNADYEQWMSKWNNFMLQNGNKEIQKSPDLKMLVRSGIPHKYRGSLWKRFVDLRVKNIRERVKSNYYHTLLSTHTNVNRLDPFVKQIELDLLRTLPNNKHYETLHSDGIPRLRRVLLAYNWHNPAVGYCQGLNRLAAVALLFLDEEDTFWCLVAIVEKIMPVDYYSTTLITSQVDQRVLKDLMQEKLPQLSGHLEVHNVDLSLVTFAWLLTVFVDNIPVKTYLNIWDSFLYEGSKILFRYALAIFKYTEEDLLKLNDYMLINTYLRSFAQTLSNVKALNQIAFHGLSSFSMRSISTKRTHHMQIVRRELEQLQALRSSEYVDEKRDSPSDED